MSDSLLNLLQNAPSLHYDYKKISTGDAFFAIDIYTQDDGVEIPHGEEYISQALKQGAQYVITEKKHLENVYGNKIIYHPNPRKALSLATSHRFAPRCSLENKVAITGTNGKTSTSFILNALLQKDHPAIRIGTLGSLIHRQEIKSKDTTPESPELWKLLLQASQASCRSLVMEVSSHGIDFERIYGVDFNRLIFTNLTPDHLDYHKTFENYKNTKLRLFTESSPNSLAAINIDDEHGLDFKKACRGTALTYGLKKKCDVSAKKLRFSDEGAHYILSSPWGNTLINSPLLGEYNVSNQLAAATIALSLDISLQQVKEVLEAPLLIPGRFEKIPLPQGGMAVVDYAHTPDAMEKILNTVQNIASGKIITVFGCGGDRDPSKRAPMGRVAAQYSDHVILTSDNSRFENLEDIISDIDVPEAQVEKDRRQAITAALELCQENDFVLILGKGHEDYQLVGNQKHPFSDRQVVRDFVTKKRSS